MIELSDLTKKFDTFTAVDHLNLRIETGEFFGLLGPNGAGKTTTISLMSTLLLPTEGEIRVDGEVLSRKNPGLKRKISVITQEYSMRQDMTMDEVMEYQGRLYFMPRKKIREKTEELLEFCGLIDFRRRTVRKLSGGMKRKLMVCRALLTEPEILLLDEPLGALDLKLRKEMQLELKRLQREMNITFIYVTHDQEEALTMSDTVVVMNGGKVQQIGTPEDIYNEPKNAFVADFIGDSNIVDGVMHKDFLVSFSGVDFPCVDRGFAREQSVQVVVRPEDIEVVSPVEGQLVGVVNDVIFKGVHFEMHVECEGREWLIHSTRACTPGETIGMRIGPNEIHIMARSEG